MKIVAGGKLNSKKARQTPSKAQASGPAAPDRINPAAIIADMPAAMPSAPSSRLKALINVSMKSSWSMASTTATPVHIDLCP
jgi:hypothetical protein